MPSPRKREGGGGDRLVGAEGVALDAGDLDEAADRVAGHAEMVLHADLGGVLDLLVGAAEHRREPAGGHRGGDADLALAADLGARDRGVHLAQDGDGRGREQEVVGALAPSQSQNSR